MAQYNACIATTDCEITLVSFPLHLGTNCQRKKPITCEIWESRCRPLALIPLVHLSYFCTCWKVNPASCRFQSGSFQHPPAQSGTASDVFTIDPAVLGPIQPPALG